MAGAHCPVPADAIHWIRCGPLYLTSPGPQNLGSTCSHRITNLKCQVWSGTLKLNTKSQIGTNNTASARTSEVTPQPHRRYSPAAKSTKLTPTFVVGTRLCSGDRIQAVAQSCRPAPSQASNLGPGGHRVGSDSRAPASFRGTALDCARDDFTAHGVDDLKN